MWSYRGCCFPPGGLRSQYPERCSERLVLIVCLPNNVAIGQNLAGQGHVNAARDPIDSLFSESGNSLRRIPKLEGKGYPRPLLFVPTPLEQFYEPQRGFGRLASPANKLGVHRLHMNIYAGRAESIGLDSGAGSYRQAGPSTDTGKGKFEMPG